MATINSTIKFEVTKVEDGVYTLWAVAAVTYIGSKVEKTRLFPERYTSKAEAIKARSVVEESFNRALVPFQRVTDPGKAANVGRRAFDVARQEGARPGTFEKWLRS